MAKADVLELDRGNLDALPAVRVGWIVGWSADGWTVDFPGNPGDPVVARSTIALDAAAIQRAVETRQGVVLVFERGRADLPIVLGLVQSPIADALPTMRVDADGKRLELEAKDEIVLRCGPSSITLRRNGRVLIKGECIETRASGRNRIKGGSVQIN
jgi:hypothetical protein